MVAQQGIPDGALGQCLAFGLTPVQLDVVDEEHNFATPIEEDTTKLRTAGTGPARVYYKESGTGTKWGIVLVGMVGGTGGLRCARVSRIGPALRHRGSTRARRWSCREERGTT